MIRNNGRGDCLLLADRFADPSSSPTLHGHPLRQPNNQEEERVVMPLIIFSGLPSSGKTTRALQLQKALEDKISSSTRKFKIHLINDDSLGINRQVYQGTSCLLTTWKLMHRCKERESCSRDVFQCYSTGAIKRYYRHCRWNELHQRI